MNRAMQIGLVREGGSPPLVPLDFSNLSLLFSKRKVAQPLVCHLCHLRFSFAFFKQVAHIWHWGGTTFRVPLISMIILYLYIK
jgi:hypothetical protein